MHPGRTSVAIIIMLVGLEIAIFGFVPGMTDPERLQNTSITLVFISAILNVISFVAGFGHDLRRMDLNRGGMPC